MDSDDSYFGFIGKLLKIDLTHSSISIEKVAPDVGNLFLGGAGYACRYLIDYINKYTNPLSSENVLFIMTGPLCLTGAPSSSRLVICSKSPYTGLWGEANAGGFFGPELKKAGYDGIVIKGKAEKPTFIKIFDDFVELVEAKDLWGKGVKYCHKKLKVIAEMPKSRVLCIGQAGENLVKYANVNTEGRSAGRTGMGAIMGSKKLKGIVVKGNKHKPMIYNPIEFNKIVKKTTKFILNTLATKVLRDYGTSSAVAPLYSIGDLPIKYWSKGQWDGVSNITGEKLINNFFIKRKSCYGCSIACGKIVKFKNLGTFIKESEGPEYETIAGFGSMILNNNLESIAMANHLCNDYGLDTISTSSIISLLYNLYNKRSIKSQDVDNLDLKWGNYENMLKLINKIVFREGVGNLLAEGSNKVGEQFKIPSDDIATVNNLEIPYHDIRSCYGLALTYAFAPRGACHTSGDVFKVLRKENEIDFSSLGIKKVDLFSNDSKMAKSTILLHDYRAVYSSLISCFFFNPPPKDMTDLIRTLMGFEYNLDDMKIMGERIFNIKRLFNIKMGLTSENDNLPKIVLTPTKEGAVAGKSPDFNKLKQSYYLLRDWSPETGIPNKKKLLKLGINNIKN
ncbi:MAG: aldehyde ferredoxin oxidoreductase family protein [Promethearchaeota archaeon]